MSAIPCIKTELKYSNNIEKTKVRGETNDMRKMVSFQPQVLKCTKSYAEAVKDSNKESKIWV